MKYFIFDLQRFATTEIKANQSAVIDSVTFTAKENAVLNLDDNEKVSGIAGGKVVATLEDNPDVQVAFDGGRRGFISGGRIVHDVIFSRTPDARTESGKN